MRFGKARDITTLYFQTYTVIRLLIQNANRELQSCLKFQLLKVLGFTCKYNAIENSMLLK
jgi:hypothetical protein